MNSRALSTLAIVGFVLLGTICLGLRYRARSEATVARQVTLWELTYTVHFEAALSAPGQEEARVSLAIPFDTQYSELLNRSQITWTTPNPNLRAEVRGPFKSTGNEMLALTTRQEGTYDASVSFRLRLSPTADPSRQPPLENLTLDDRSRFLSEVESLPLNDENVRQRAQAIVGDATDEAQQIQRIFAYCMAIDSSPSDTAADGVLAVLSSGRGTPLGRARTMVALCRVMKIPSRLVTGFKIAQGSDVKPHVWVEVFQRQAWLPFDPSDGWSLELPMNFVPVRRNFDQVYEATPNLDQFPGPRYSIRVLEREANVLQGRSRHPIQILDLTRLPVPMHTVLKILLLLPFAALITAILRNVVGLLTFGTFSPALLAMSFIYAELSTGLAILAIVVSVGLVGRTFLEKLRLLMVPRLSIILTLVILCVVFGISILYYLVEPLRVEVVLLPMVIMTMLIERFHVTAEEDGIMYTIKLAAGTLLVAILCYLVLLNNEVGKFILTYPEAHFYTIAMFIFLGRYAGYRLTELWRFRDLVDSSEVTR